MSHNSIELSRVVPNFSSEFVWRQQVSLRSCPLQIRLCVATFCNTVMPDAILFMRGEWIDKNAVRRKSGKHVQHRDEPWSGTMCFSGSLWRCNDQNTGFYKHPFHVLTHRFHVSAQGVTLRSNSIHQGLLRTDGGRGRGRRERSGWGVNLDKPTTWREMWARRRCDVQPRFLSHSLSHSMLERRVKAVVFVEARGCQMWMSAMSGENKPSRLARHCFWFWRKRYVPRQTHSTAIEAWRYWLNLSISPNATDRCSPSHNKP